MQTFTNTDGILIAKKIIDAIETNREYLSEIDGAIGDGDHGINMAKGFAMADDTLAGSDANMSEAFKVISDMLMNKIGGSMGPLYGSMFRGFYIKSRKSDVIDGEIVGQMLEKAVSNIEMISEAKLNDKTLMDVIVPATNAYRETWDDSQSLDSALDAMCQAADAGLEATKSMVAKFGRASRLGERSLGHQDAGATSSDIILKALAVGIKELI